MEIEKIAVIGAGTMGAGIAQWFAQQEVKVELVDNNSEQAKKALNNITSSWEKLQKKGKFKPEEISSFNDKISIATIENLSENYDLIIEAIFENLEIKKQLFKKLTQIVSDKTLIASNTSSFPIAQLCEDLPIENKQRFLGLHFFNPATIMKLVEIIPSAYIEEDRINALYKWFDERGKKPAKCADSPGFIVNRVARNFYGESLRIAKTDNEKKYIEIDEVLREVGGFRMGPFELMDLIGVDVNLNVSQSVWEAFYREPRFAPHQLQKSLVQQGRNGKKSGRGFYNYE